MANGQTPTAPATMKTYKGPAKVKGKVVGEWSLTGPADSGAFKVWVSTLSGDSLTDTFKAWYYGAKLKAMGPVRAAVLAGQIDNHKILAGGKSTDLDTLPVGKAIAVVNALRAAAAAGMGAGDKNMAKIEHFAKGLVDKGTAKDTNGTLSIK